MINQKLTDKPQFTGTLPDDALLHVVLPNDLTQGVDGSDYKIFVDDLLPQAGQDNIAIRKYVVIDYDDTINEIVDKINALPAFTINEKQSVWFVSRIIGGQIPQRIVKFKMMNRGKGNYGTGGTVLFANDLELVYDNIATILDVENDPTTDTVLYGDITGQTVSEWLNEQTEAIVIQPQDDGYTIFKGSVDGETTTYLWIGEAGVYGVGESQSTMADFQILSDTSVTDDNNVKKNPSPETSQDISGSINVNDGVFVNKLEPTEDNELTRKDYVVTKSVEVWVAGTYPENKVVSKIINGKEYIFRSKIDNNTTVPYLYSTEEAYEVYEYAGSYVGVWSAGSYVTGNIVSRSGYAYYCVSSTSSDPATLSDATWIKIGVFQGLYNGATVYNNGDVVIDGSNVVYVSNYDNNLFPLNYGVVSQWEVINGNPVSIIANGDSMTFGTGSNGLNSYPDYLGRSTGLNIQNTGVAGETSTQIATRFFANFQNWQLPHIFWVGRNNVFAPATVKADIAAMISKLKHDRYLVVGVTKAVTEVGTPTGAGIDALNADLKALYGNRFVDMDALLYSVYNTSIPQDVADHAAGKIAWSLRSDLLHLNNLGYAVAAKFIQFRLNFLLGSDDFNTRDLSVSGNGKFNGSLVEITGSGNPALQVTSKSTGSFPIMQLIDIARSGGGDWNIENGRILTKLSFSSGSLLNAIVFNANGSASFSGEVTVPAATVGTSAPQLQQVVTLSGAQTVTGVKDFPSSMTIPDGLASNNPVSVNQLNATNAVIVSNFNASKNFTGWAQYSGTNYTIGSPLVINAGNTSVLANNGAASTITTQLPTGVTAFVNTANGKITPQSDGDFYVIDIRFKATSSSVDGVIDIGIDIGGAMGIIRQHTISLRKGIGVEQRVALSFPVFSGSTFVANGGEVKVSSIVGNTSIYDVTFVVDRTHKAK